MVGVGETVEALLLLLLLLFGLSSFGFDCAFGAGFALPRVA
jgi:hypothetical protein